MIIFIDESGDAGFQITRGSSKTFTIALVIFDSDPDAEDTAKMIHDYKVKKAKSKNFEFKFNKSNFAERVAFLNVIANAKFRVRAIVFQKELIYSEILRTVKDKFYNYAVKCVLKNSNDTIKNAKIRIDASSDKTFKNELKVYLRKELNKLNKRVTADIKFRDSRKDLLIQLADMVAGSINRSYLISKSDHRKYLNIIEKRIEDKWEFR